jgi:serine protease Do
MERHANILYLLVIFLLVFQMITFIFVSIQFTRLNSKVDFELNRVETDVTEYFSGLIISYNEEYQRNFNDLGVAVAQQAVQQETFEREIKLVKSGQDDFSGIIEDAIKGVVSVLTDTSMGSGFIISPDGYVVTNFHVVENSDRIRVLTYDNKIASATIIGSDKLRDLVLLKIEGDYGYLNLANSDDLQVGNKVIAVGNPLGLSFTVTEGIVSALGRAGPNGIKEYIQTDVSLNPGNSGGPLINTLGEIVGINNFKIGGAEALGFALESDSIRTTINGIAGSNIIS